MPNNSNSLLIKTDSEEKTILDKQESNEFNYQAAINPQQIITNTNLKPILSHEYKNQINQKEYKYIQSDILDKIQLEQISLSNINSYFTTNTSLGGRITNQNIPAFAYLLPRIRCILENLFQLTYKSKIYYRTAITIYKAIEEMLASEYIKQLPNDFPFIDDMIKLHEQFSPMAKYLEHEKDGTKFKLSKTAIVRYILILNLIRHCSKKEPFAKLFPNLCKPVAHTKPNTSKV